MSKNKKVKAKQAVPTMTQILLKIKGNGKLQQERNWNGDHSIEQHQLKH